MVLPLALVIPLLLAGGGAAGVGCGTCRKTSQRASQSQSQDLDSSHYPGSVAGVSPSLAVGQPFKSLGHVFELDEEVIQMALKHPLAQFENNKGGGASFLQRAKAFHFLAVAGHLKPERTDISAKVLQHIRHFTSGGKEPSATGNLEGWSHNHVAHALALVRRSPHMWDALSAVEHGKVDLLMETLIIAANWVYNDENSYKTGLNGDYTGGGANTMALKAFGPNFREGYVGVAIAGSLYFGPERFNHILTDFNYDGMISRLTAARFTNVTACWSKTGKELMERGGRDPHGGSGRGVKVPFMYQGVPAHDVISIYHKLVTYNYDRVCKSTVYPKKEGVTASAFVVSKVPSPYEGRKGMMYEFDSSDRGGFRSDALYVYLGWMNSITNLVSLLLIGPWDVSGARERQIVDLVEVGSEDFIHKAEQGYQGFEKGEVRITRMEDFTVRGYHYTTHLWRKVVREPLLTKRREPTAPASGEASAKSAHSS